MASVSRLACPSHDRVKLLIAEIEIPASPGFWITRDPRWSVVG
jgi:hypothetical protein